MFTMDDLLEIAVKMEKNGEAVYIDSVDKMPREELRQMVEWMAQEEAAHAKWFTGMQNRLKLDINEADLKEMVPSALQGMMGDKTLSLEEIDFTAIATTDELIRTFIGFEKDTIAFYEVLEMFIEDETVLSGLRKIIEEEKNHVRELESRLGSLV